MKRMHPARWGALLALVVGLPAWAATGSTPPPPEFEAHHVTDGLGRDITYYVSHPPKPAPLLLLIQGSGCIPAWTRDSQGRVASTIFMAWPAQREARFTVLIVDKPFATDGSNPPGTALGCSRAFNRDFSADRWLQALLASLTDARRLPWVDRSRTLVFGHSEGSIMAALVAGHDPEVTDVVAFSGSGTNQLFDLFAQAYERCFDRSACLKDLEDQARAINAKPDSGDDFAWGHPYKRWSSFFRVFPEQELLHSKARVYIGGGTSDRNMPVLSMEVAAAALIGAGRDVTVRRAPDADHALNSATTTTESEYRRALAWFWGEPLPESSLPATAKGF